MTSLRLRVSPSLHRSERRPAQRSRHCCVAVAVAAGLCSPLVGTLVAPLPALAAPIPQADPVPIVPGDVPDTSDGAQEGKLTIETLVTPRDEYISRPVMLYGDEDDYVMLPGKKTQPADPAVAASLPGYNPYLYLTPEGDGPDLDEVELTKGYRPDQLVTLYRSDVPPRLSYIRMLSGFPQAMNNSQIYTQNLETVLRINNNASVVQIQRAVEDADDDNVATFSEALGTHMGAIFRDLYNSGQLPKMWQLVGGSVSRSMHFTNATGLEKAYYHNKRPFALARDRVKYYYEDLGDAQEDENYRNLVWSFPSGHTNRAFIKGITLAYIFPEWGTQILTRASEGGYNRLVLGVHYPLDVIAGRMTASATMAYHLADPRFAQLIREAAVEVRTAVEKKCGMSIADCGRVGRPFLSTQDSVKVYTERLTYGFPTIGPRGESIIVPEEAESLLRSRFPQLSPAQRRYLLAVTATDSGYPLDRGGHDGAWLRLNLARAFATKVQVTNGSMQILYIPPAG